MSRDLYKKISDTVNKYDMFPKNGKVIVGVSGGADSMALIHFLSRFLSKDRITVCHVNHSIRGDEADRDEEFVGSFCSQNGLSFKAVRLDVPKIAKQKKIGLEECGRELRYGFFSSFIENKDDRIATAHTLSDLAETAVFRFITGTSVRGLVGISPVRNNIVRPLIELTREEIEEYCKENGIDFITDSTNLSDEYTRNFIRHQIIPKMKEINPSFEKRVLSLSQSAGEDEAYFAGISVTIKRESKTDKGYKAEVFRKYGMPCAVRALRDILESEGANRLSFVQLSSCLEIIEKGEGKVSLPGNISLICEFDLFNIAAEKEEKSEGFSRNVGFFEPVSAPNGEFLISKTDKNVYFSENNKKINNLLLSDAFDCDIISQSLILRSRKPGDKFAPRGRKVTKTLKKLFSEAKIPKEQREKLCVLEENGKIIWVEKFGVSEQYKITEKTENVAVITLKKQGE